MATVNGLTDAGAAQIAAALTSESQKSSASSGTSSTGASSRSSLSREDFYKIMISELSNQDPFQPMDNQQFLAQLASLQTLDTTSRLSDGIEKLVLQQRFASASSLIGHEIRAASSTYIPGTDGMVKGTVESVQLSGGDVELVLSGDRKVSLDSVVEIS